MPGFTGSISGLTSQEYGSALSGASGTMNAYVIRVARLFMQGKSIAPGKCLYNGCVFISRKSLAVRGARFPGAEPVLDAFSPLPIRLSNLHFPACKRDIHYVLRETALRATGTETTPRVSASRPEGKNMFALFFFPIV
jgi:hypothetical protein